MLACLQVSLFNRLITLLITVVKLKIKNLTERWVMGLLISPCRILKAFFWDCWGLKSLISQQLFYKKKCNARFCSEIVGSIENCKRKLRIFLYNSLKIKGNLLLNNLLNPSDSYLSVLINLAKNAQNYKNDKNQLYL